MGINAVFNQFFYDAAWPFNHLASSDLVGKAIVHDYYLTHLYNLTFSF
jgi:hypothetical protein